jgi:hypothetical protein
MTTRNRLARQGVCALVGLFLTPSLLRPSAAQQARSSQNVNSFAEAALEAKIDALSAKLDETQSELSESRSEIRELRATLLSVTQKLDAPQPAGTSGEGAIVQNSDSLQTDAPTGAKTAGPPAKISQDDWDVLNSRVDQDHQVKVESASRFPLRLSGMFLLNTVMNSGHVDNFDLPTEAVLGASPFGSTGFSLRQSVIGIDGIGPRIIGADTSADVQADFYGGLSSGYGASGAGVMRLRLARMRFDWQGTSIIGGLDTPFFSPQSPTSYLTVAEPGMSASGNMWTWSPQLRVEQRFNTKIAQFRAEAGVIDIPSYSAATSGNRVASPNEASREPSYALRLSANGHDQQRPLTLGLAGIWVTQHFPGSVNPDGGGGAFDWNFPFSRWASLSGEMFAGKGLDGFGAAPVPTVTTQNYSQYVATSAPLLARVGMYGGWSQFKVRLNSRSEINFATGGSARDSASFRAAAAQDSIVQTLSFKNESLMINYIFRPRSDLIFSTEYRRLRTYQLSGTASAGETGLSAGFLF